MSFNCSLLSGVEAEMCAVINAQNLVCYDPATAPLGYREGDACFTYASANDKLAALAGTDNFVDAGNTAWMLISAALVMIMTPGVGLFYAGLAGEETAGNTLMMAFGSMIVVSIQWYLFGYSFAFGPGTLGWGSFDWGVLTHVGGAPSGAYGFNIPHICFCVFQLMFAQITPALISGAVIGRMKFTSFLIFVFIWTTLVYDPLAHWSWSLAIDPSTGGIIAGGFLGVLPNLDFAGGGVIHISSGFAALAAALVVGRRYNHGDPVKPHNAPMVIIGATLLWFGWFGFNAGSAGGSGNYSGYTVPASIAFFNTHLAAAAACLTWMLTEKLVDKKITATGAAVGSIAGLVAVTPACGWVDIYGALIIGLVVSPICFFAAKLKSKLGVDDTLDSFPIHGVGGLVGAFSTGLFASKATNIIDGAFYGNPVQLGYQVAGLTVSASYSFTLTFIILTVMKKTIGLRVSDEMEQEGIDKSEHGGKSYNN